MDNQVTSIRFSAATFQHLASLLLAYSLNLPIVPSRFMFTTFLLVKCSAAKKDTQPVG